VTDPGVAIPVLGVLVVAGAFLTLVGEYGRRRWMVYLFKPLTTLAIVAAALVDQGTTPPLYRRAVVAGLAFSLLGDVLLMLPRDRFVPGLASFFAAHLCYVAAFLSPGRPVLPLSVVLPLLLFAALLLSRVEQGAGRLAPLLALYAGALTAMAWLAVGRWTHVHTLPAAFAGLGALLFVLSDSALAYDRFRVAFHKAPAVVLATYYAAQWLIARSV
jgi:uncharacterized membrane protein YhhN